MMEEVTKITPELHVVYYKPENGDKWSQTEMCDVNYYLLAPPYNRFSFNTSTTGDQFHFIYEGTEVGTYHIRLWSTQSPEYVHFLLMADQKIYQENDVTVQITRYDERYTEGILTGTLRNIADGTLIEILFRFHMEKPQLK